MMYREEVKPGLQQTQARHESHDESSAAQPCPINLVSNNVRRQHLHSPEVNLRSSKEPHIHLSTTPPPENSHVSTTRSLLLLYSVRIESIDHFQTRVSLNRRFFYRRAAYQSTSTRKLGFSSRLRHWMFLCADCESDRKAGQPVPNSTILPSNTSTRHQITEHADLREYNGQVGC